MDDILTAVRTARGSDLVSAPLPQTLIQPVDQVAANETDTQLSSSRILELLQSSPSKEDLYTILRWLDPSKQNQERGSFDIRYASSAAAPILRTLVNKTIPDHWQNFDKESSKERGALLRCLCSVSGLRALVTILRISIDSLKSSPHKEKDSGKKAVIQEIISFISALLKPKDFVYRIYQDNISIYETSSKQWVAWSELCAFLAGGKVLSVIGEAMLLTEEKRGSSLASWAGEGGKFAAWLGRNMGHMAHQAGQDDKSFWKATSFMVGRAVSLGYTDKFVHELYTCLVERETLSPSWDLFFNDLRPYEQVTIIQSIFKDLQKTYLVTGSAKAQDNDQIVGGVAALLSHFLKSKDSLQETVKSWLVTGNNSFVTSVGLRRVLILLNSKDPESIKDLLTQCLSSFGDPFNIKHDLLQFQEANTQVLLLAAGYLHRSQPAELKIMGQSALYLNAISNRLAASSSRARLFGMIVSMAISNLCDPHGKGLKFDLDEVETEEAEWYMNLTHVKDSIGSIQYLKNFSQIETEKATKEINSSRFSQPAPSKISRPTTKIVAIEEISDNEDDEDDEDLTPYEKPDNDTSDEEDDPTLIQRGKPTAPVYIRDLIAYLKDTENGDRYHLGVTSAVTLIRRKAAYGTELLENIDSLALTIMSLQDNFSLSKFHEHRLQAMIALVVAQPVRMGRLFTATFFDGDLSQTQRSAILTALGLGARELAGHGEDDAEVMGLPLSASSQEKFPSKKLPQKLQGMYLAESEESPISALTNQLSRTSLQPLALDAADAASGPNALKVRTFSSRMEVERQRRQREAQRKKKIVSLDLHKDLSEGIFYPLVGRFAVMIQSNSAFSNGYNSFNSPNTLRLFIQTITLVISTLGPHTPVLPNVSQETLTLILALHGKPISSEPIILPALLSLLLAVIDLNTAAGSSAEESLVTEHASQVMELREWTNEVFERTPISTGNKTSPEEQIDDLQQTRILAAGILVKIGEIVERYQRRLMGVNVGFKY
ncbi:telomere length regulation protein-domain-containing protein [Talaromyces proteolyticus]|uniref:Telomere length regulation protein-domain-containing protein n=1 Tax=Talaromyces proteolyticus TaxID=1131652 RepID=A0AAD4L3E4_9EURO|nr:telomere length regulation protein-domain-containing protein [Talaromyces proteolyticus]KAH8705202.1 telomere length regulation protein-domain-containing protein [Talaromyces proteolyticus]